MLEILGLLGVSCANITRVTALRPFQIFSCKSLFSSLMIENSKENHIAFELAHEVHVEYSRAWFSGFWMWWSIGPKISISASL